MEEQNQKKSLNRRTFIRNTSIAAAGFYIVPRHVLGRGFTAPSDKLTIASVGAGGKGGDDIQHFYKSGKANIAFLCDVDDRQSVGSRKLLPAAKYYHDWREMFDKESGNFDAVSVSIPDHNHAIVALNAMKMGKHVYVQKPLTHDIFEARMLTEAAKKYRVVTQMGDQGASGDGVRQLMEWYHAGIIGRVHTVNCFTNRPVWPQGIPWPTVHPPIPAELNWDLWLGTAQEHDYIDNLVPFNWRGWWDFGTGALGDMGCHIIGPVFKVLSLEYPTAVTCSCSTVYDGIFKQAYRPDGGPVSSSVHFKYKDKHGNEVKLNWMDGGIQPERPRELKPNEMMGGPGDPGNGVIFEGTKGKMMCSTYADNPQLLPTSRTNKVHVRKTIPRIPGGAEGHYAQWIEASLAGYKHGKTDSPFVGYAGPLTECILMGNLAIRSFNYRDPNGKSYPGRGITLQWDGPKMQVTNFDPANQFVKRTYREGWPALTL
ncbi:MAG TPA: Gfo/Idh/MocA family oxidoreductase [Chitinophagaceae bacterium]|nr:Gfo/Idh/MocA family oxidoreductase [Chitinophagaceae bacterium]